MLEFSNFFSLIAGEIVEQNPTDPLYQALSLIGPYAISVVVSLGLIYGIIIGAKFAKATDTQERATLQKALINGIIGFVSVVILITILYAIRAPLARWINS